ncbi:hypothetical protein ACFO25_04565 [Paenactinomyces guangxiensis]|uniref:Uncharacterized protein n=1 Tax=Paenactinomyces guangxiensis TaxID=1490290 RepID=A0A7W2A6Q4_9BACL|nr:hypothetical protein [Paenactinomyces guangxiensis]MBA4493651.1 hypothetical protein [Paenactinomyces guangxiensis]MBH8590938.1 hypothetical protein [Paenactinomyces guangxiensis]
MNNYLLWILADGPGKKLQETLGGEIGSLFFLVVIFVSLTLFWKRAFTAFIGFALFAMLVSVFIFQPQLIQSLGSDGFKWLFEAYIK